MGNRHFLIEGVVVIRSHIQESPNAMTEPQFIIEEVTDPVAIARSKQQHERHKRNTDWLQSHWGDLLPQARGKFLAVANQEAYLANTPEEAWAWAGRTHPEDNGAFVRYVRTGRGPRFYGSRTNREDSQSYQR
jgi:hypothetical protein